MKEVTNNNQTLESFGEKMRSTRLSLGITQEELAAMIQSSRSFVSSVELGKTNPSILTLIKICHALSIQDINFLLNRDT